MVGANTIMTDSALSAISDMSSILRKSGKRKKGFFMKKGKIPFQPTNQLQGALCSVVVCGLAIKKAYHVVSFQLYRDNASY